MKVEEKVATKFEHFSFKYGNYGENSKSLSYGQVVFITFLA